MKLYCVAVAPNPTKVQLYVAEKKVIGAPLAIEEITVKLMKGEQHSAAHIARTPFATLPVLEIEPGDYIIESLAIMEYLEDCYPDPTMRGRTPRASARNRELERIIDLRVLTPIGRFVHATNSPLGLAPSEELAALALQGASSGLSYVDDLLADGREFVNGEHVSFGDCTLAAALQFGRFGQFSALEGFQHVLRWDAEFRARPAAKAVLVA